MRLVLKEKMCLSTPNGTSEIQLLFGDITTLPVEDKVDILFASAFPGDYTLVPGTMMYALKSNLGLSVSSLAKNKAHNFLRTLNCWVSQPLPDHLPFKRLVCFERMNRLEPLPDQISGVFRAMMPIFNNQESTVITPLLASGNQGHSEVMILKAITTAACHWIKAGLPLKCLKIVVYTQNPARLSDFHCVLANTFCQLKSVWEKNRDEEELKQAEKKYDVCLSFTSQDKELVKKVCSGLQVMQASIVIHKDPFIFNHEEVWQEEIFTVMVQSRRIVTILTPAYVDDPECLEQYNLALCCNRLTGTEMLNPFYLASISVFPSYMTLIQYTDCRVRKAGEQSEEKIIKACSLLVTAIDKDKETVTNKAIETASETTSSKSSESSIVYDVFISYAHKTPREALKLYDSLLEIEPNLKVFLDRSELRTGNSWQEALYESLDKAKVVVTFITDSYMKSTVCQEEYNIAFARYLTMDGIYFVPLLIDTDITEVPSMYSGAPLVDMKDPSQRVEEQYYNLAEAPIRWLRALEKGIRITNVFCQPARKYRISYITSLWREEDFKKRFTTKNRKYVEMTEFSAKTVEEESTKATDTKHVVFSCTNSCFGQAAILARYLTEETRVKVKCEFLSSPSDTMMKKQPNMQLLDLADMIVVLVSNDYMVSSQHRHEVHIALCRQRMCKDKRVVYLIQSNHSQRRPVYSHLLPNTINLEDEMWRFVARIMECPDRHLRIKLPDLDPVSVFCSGAEQQALSVAALDIVDKLLAGNQATGGSGMPTNIVNLIDMMNKAESLVPTSKLLVDFSHLTGTKEEEKLSSADVSTVLPDPPSHAPGQVKADNAAGKQDITSAKQDATNSAGKQDKNKSAEKQDTEKSPVKQDPANSSEKQDRSESAGKQDMSDSARKQDTETSAGKQRVENVPGGQGTTNKAIQNWKKADRKSSACRIV